MILQPVTHTLYTIVSSIILNIIVTDFRTNVRFRILVRHGSLSEKLISVVGQMSVSDKCPRINLTTISFIELCLVVIVETIDALKRKTVYI